MKMLRFLLPGLLLALLLTAFRPAVTRETRSVGSFTAVNLGGSMRVVLRQGSPQQVAVEGEADDLAHLETVVTDHQLRINTKREGRFSSYSFHQPVTVYVTTPTITGLAVSGSGSLRAADPIRAEKLKLSVSGSGNLELASVTADALDSSLSGSGNIDVSGGTAPDQQISVSGSGGVRAEQLASKTCSVRIAGSGNCRVQATETLDARIAGSGGVYVSGNPRVSSSVAGSGRVHKL